MKEEKQKEENGGIVYIDVSDYAKKLKNFGEYHKDKRNVMEHTGKQELYFYLIMIDKVIPSFQSKSFDTLYKIIYT